jgi:hypothetical protein
VELTKVFSTFFVKSFFKLKKGYIFVPSKQINTMKKSIKNSLLFLSYMIFCSGVIFIFLAIAGFLEMLVESLF